MNTPYSKAWAEFIKSTEGKLCLARATRTPDDARYAENRVHAAFDAGWNARALHEESRLSDEHLRDLIIRAHGMATANYVQSDSEMRRRIGVMLDEAIKLDDTMRAFLSHTENGHAAPGSLSRRSSDQ
jgi:hypothetical protein